MKFRVVTNEREQPEFHDIVAWGKLAETCANYLSKGHLVYLEGRLHSNTWLADDGSKRRSVEVVASAMQLLSPKPPATSAEAPTAVGEDEIPF